MDVLIVWFALRLRHREAGNAGPFLSQPQKRFLCRAFGPGMSKHLRPLRDWCDSPRTPHSVLTPQCVDVRKQPLPDPGVPLSRLQCVSGLADPIARRTGLELERVVARLRMWVQAVSAGSTSCHFKVSIPLNILDSNSVRRGFATVMKRPTPPPRMCHVGTPDSLEKFVRLWTLLVCRRGIVKCPGCWRKTSLRFRMALI